jgi:hypothetical protein
MISKNTPQVIVANPALFIKSVYRDEKIFPPKRINVGSL